MNLTDYTGVIHLHSGYSFDGRAPVAEIVAAANVSGVDFLLLTDHGTLQARADGWEGWQGRTLVIVGEEVAPRFNHLLAFQLARSLIAPEDPPECLPPQTYLDRIRNQGGLSFIAHPDHQGCPLFHVKQYPWTDWSVTGYTGIGVWDFMTDWQNSLTGYLRAALSFIWPALFLRGPSPETLARWDRLSRERPVVGIGELDNHDTVMRIGGFALSVFPFSRVFRLIRTHLLTASPLSGDSPNDIAVVLDALGRGHAYVSLDSYCTAAGFSLLLREGDRSATMGDTFTLHHSAEFTATVPAKARIRLVRNGVLLHQTTGTELSLRLTEPGTYRIEADLRVYCRWRPWIFSNPVRVTGS
ncbi:MAG: CehA/McbA family metallohydrolase [Syntrophales bacterium]